MGENESNDDTQTKEQKELERLRVQLAGCGVIAKANTRKALAEAMPASDAYGWSVSLQDVYDAVLREIEERESASAYLAVLISLVRQIEPARLRIAIEELRKRPHVDKALIDRLFEPFIVPRSVLNRHRYP